MQTGMSRLALWASAGPERAGRCALAGTCGGLACAGLALPVRAGAAPFAPELAAAALFPGSYYSLAAVVFAIAVFIWAIIVVRRMSRTELAARRHIASLEVRLNEAEAILAAEPGVLMIWQGGDEVPVRISGDMRWCADIPQNREKLQRFSSWLDGESVDTVERALAGLRSTGKPFNVAIKTHKGELIEAEGRAAGGQATLRFRPLAGDRRACAGGAYDTRKLGKQVERLSAVLDSSPFPVWMRNEAGALIWVNKNYLKAVEVASISDVLKRQTPLADTRELGTGTGENGFVGRSHAVIGGNQHALDIYEVAIEHGTAGFAVDMTGLEVAEKELERHIRSHAGTLDKLATAIAIFGPDQRLRFYNSAYARLWPLDETWLDSHPGNSEILDRLRAARQLPEQANYRDWKARQLTAYTTIETREEWWHLPDGRSLRVICEQHPIGGVTFLFEDLTEMVSLESRFNEMIGVQRETLDNLHEGIGLFGPDGCLRLFNPAYADIWKLEEKFLTGKPHIDAIIAKCRSLQDDAELWDDLKYTVTASVDSRTTSQGQLTRPDGMILDYSCVPLPDGNTLLTYVDVTDSAGMERALRDRNEALEAADRLKTHFLSNVSYELRTPLNSIRGFSEGLTLGIAGELTPKQTEYLEHIETASTDLLAVIDAILDLTTIDAGAMELELAEVPVLELMETAAADVKKAAAGRDLTLTIEIAGDVENLMCDARRTGQVLVNLLSNAIGFSTHGAKVRMGARRDGDTILLWVADTGRGMDEDMQKKAFERFQSRPVTGGHRGPGLGLALVKSFVELHDGSVSLVSRLNRGTTVICRFPLAGPRDQRMPGKPLLSQEVEQQAGSPRARPA